MTLPQQEGRPGSSSSPTDREASHARIKKALLDAPPMRPEIGGSRGEPRLPAGWGPTWPVPPSRLRDNRDAFWMGIAWLTASQSDGNSSPRALPLGAVSTKSERIVCMAPAPYETSGIPCPALALLAAHAREGISLSSASCWLWPGYLGGNGFELLVFSGVRQICVPAAPIPERFSEQWTSFRFLAERQGVQLQHLEVGPLFEELRRSLNCLPGHFDA